ncbi:MAG: hypothetical protein JSR82_18725 [Verrucomicrobia bacterium]|nr:hypothetical protein [Verrucomicrobiota bacterium]
MRGVLFLALASLLASGSLPAADPYDVALEARIARLERLAAQRPERRGAAARWKDPATARLRLSPEQRARLRTTR